MLSSFRGFFRKFATSDNTSFIGFPFKISKSDAINILNKNNSIFEQTKDVNITINNKNLSQLFLPFQSVSINNVSSSFRGKFGIDKTEPYIYYVYNGKYSSPRVGFRTVIEWHNFAITSPKHIDYPHGLLDTQIYAGSEYPKKYVENVLPMESHDDIKQLSLSELHDFNNMQIYIEPHKITSAYAIENVITIIKRREMQRAREYIKQTYRCDEVNISHLEMHFDKSNINLINYFLPAYVYCSDPTNTYVVKIINGQTGKYSDIKIYSYIKSFIGGSLIGLLLIPFVAVPGGMLMTTLIGSMISGLSTGTYSVLQHNIRSYFAKNSSIKEINNDKHSQLSIEDTTIRQNAINFNQQYSSVSETNETVHYSDKYDNEQMYENKSDNNYEGDNKANNNYEDVHKQPIYENDNITQLNDILSILELESINDLTKDKLKTAYMTQLKRWHPDVYVGKDKIFASNMTIAVNYAYRELSKIVKN